MTAPDKAEILEVLNAYTAKGRLDDAVGEFANAVDDLYDLDDMRKSEIDALDRMLSEAINDIRVRLFMDLEAAVCDATLRFAAEYPDAPRAKPEPVLA